MNYLITPDGTGREDAMGKRPKTAIVQLKLRMREPLRAHLEKAAKARGVSLNNEAVDRLERSVERLGLLEEILTLVYGPKLGKLLAAAHVHGNILTLPSQADKDRIISGVMIRVHELIDPIPVKGEKKS
jgi:hypothetical protein